ncbi:hypothetical protein LSTR_LSTR010121 [Laodelphax striatellus]|uniref:Dynein attachment factor N-terminal domain-containing protein n=1 Tax=Laodelphax striatellus TaxID=195883 RepID=A0A482WIX0_LAOST|nr:hypothetical protein LSTR_LSTR010121 [Laodelphax striatellus]
MTKENTPQETAIDLKELQEELQKAIYDDKRYWLENDAKFRAVNQGTATYDEFRDIVKAAHLRPLDGKDLRNMSSSHRGCIWNLVTDSTPTSIHNTKQSPNSTRKEVENITMSKENFFRNFKKCSSDKERFFMLRKISVNGEMARIFSSEMPIDLNVIVGALLTFEDTPESINTVYSFLKHITNLRRFELGLEFLSSTEKKKCGKLFDKLLTSTRICQQALVQLDITECGIKLLRQKYKV